MKRIEEEGERRGEGEMRGKRSDEEEEIWGGEMRRKRRDEEGR